MFSRLERFHAINHGPVQTLERFSAFVLRLVQPQAAVFLIFSIQHGMEFPAFM